MIPPTPRVSAIVWRGLHGGARNEPFGEPAGRDLRRAQALGVDVHQRERRAGELGEAQDVPDQVAREDRRPGADERDLGHHFLPTDMG
jgi:hypothetical protein